MARIHNVKSARASTKTRKCRRCGHEVQVGEPYKYIDKRVGFARFSTMRVIYCKDHYPKQSELATGKTAEFLGICEGLDDSINSSDTPEDIKEALTLAATDCESLADEYQEGADNIEEGFGHETEQSQEMAERGEEIRDFGVQLENLDIDEEGDLEELREEAASLASGAP